MATQTVDAELEFANQFTTKLWDGSVVMRGDPDSVWDWIESKLKEEREKILNELKTAQIKSSDYIFGTMDYDQFAEEVLQIMANLSNQDSKQ